MPILGAAMVLSRIGWAVLDAMCKLLMLLLPSPVPVFAAPAKLGSISELRKQHGVALAWLRDRLGPVDGPKARESWLLRMLASCNWDRRAALKKCRASFALSKRIGYDRIAKFVRENPRPEKWPHGDVVQRHLPRYFTRTDAGLVVVGLVDTDYDAACKSLSPADFREFCWYAAVFLIELLVERDEASGDIDAGLYHIMDTQFTNGVPLRWLLRMYPAFYDGGTLLGINAYVRGWYFCGARPVRAHIIIMYQRVRAYFLGRSELMKLICFIQPQRDPKQAASLQRLFEPKPLPVNFGGFS